MLIDGVQGGNHFVRLTEIWFVGLGQNFFPMLARLDHSKSAGHTGIVSGTNRGNRAHGGEKVRIDAPAAPLAEDGACAKIWLIASAQMITNGLKKVCHVLIFPLSSLACSIAASVRMGDAWQGW